MKEIETRIERDNEKEIRRKEARRRKRERRRREGKCG